MKRRAFTLVELLAAITITAILCSIAFAGYGDLREKQHVVECTSRLRSLAQSAHLYSADNQGYFPQSGHSGSSWAASLAPYLGVPHEVNPLDYRSRTAFTCPTHRQAETTQSTGWSYGLNVFFELSSQLRYTPAGLPILGSRDSYLGSPATWHRPADVPMPSRTILFAENPHTVADHFMAHQWNATASAGNAVATKRHRFQSNFVFVDGRVEMLSIEKTFAPENGTNLWNPSLAGRSP